MSDAAAILAALAAVRGTPPRMVDWTAMSWHHVPVPTMRGLAREYRHTEPRQLIGIAFDLVDSGNFDARQVAYEFFNASRALVTHLRPAEVERLGRGIDNWNSVDTFSSYIAGPAWREGVIDDARVHRWARSKDRWWRRAALVASVPLNIASRGGSGDTPRTIAVCSLLVDDHDDMVEKALSWALRELAKRDPSAVAAFVKQHQTALGARVKREVANKLTTGVKNPKKPRT